MSQRDDMISDCVEPPEPALTTRRQFLGLAGVAGLSVLLGGVTGCAPDRGALEGPTVAAEGDALGPETTAYRAVRLVTYPSREAPVTTMAVDVCVVGGGAAGMSAATLAAEMGARTVLLEESSVLGGNVTRGLVSLDRVAWGGPIMVRGWFADLIHRLARQGDATFPGPSTNFVTPCDPDALRAMALSLAREAGVDVRFGSKVIWAKVSGRRVTSVWATEHGSLVEVTAPLFIDCTGDGNLGYMAGNSCWLGERKEGAIQGQSLIFWVAPVDFERLAAYALTEGSQVETYRVVGLRRFMRDLRQSGEVEGSPQEGVLIDRNMWPDMVSISASETYDDHLEPGGLSEAVAVLDRKSVV
jgi:hypothetical protein